MKTIKLYEQKDLQNYGNNVPFYVGGYGDYQILPDVKFNEIRTDKMDSDVKTKVLFTEEIGKIQPSEISALKKSFVDGLAKKEAEIFELQEKIKAIEKSIKHFKKQQLKIKDSKTFIEAFEILIQ